MPLLLAVLGWHVAGISGAPHNLLVAQGSRRRVPLPGGQRVATGVGTVARAPLMPFGDLCSFRVSEKLDEPLYS